MPSSRTWPVSLRAPGVGSKNTRNAERPLVQAVGTGADLERLWREADPDKPFEALLQDRQLVFEMTETVFTMVPGRLTDPCSKRGLVPSWLQGVYRPQAEQLALHHYDRAPDVLAEHKESVEDRLFARARDPFWTEVDVVF